MEHDNRDHHCDGNSLYEEIATLAAGSLITEGRLEEAESLLIGTDGRPKSCAAMDLLARIAVLKGDLRRAEQLWSEILERDANNEAAQMALRRIRSPWIVYAIARRLGILVATTLIACLAVIGGMMLYQWARVALVPPCADADAPLAAPVAVSPSNAEHITDLHVAAPLSLETTDLKRPIAVQKTQSFRPPPMLTIEGCTITTNATETRIIFNDGLFAYRAELSESGRGCLESAARCLQEHTEGFWIVVEGHTDSDPMPPNSVFKDNYALGLRRAMVGVEVIRNATTIQGTNILAVSAGGCVPPFAKDRADTKTKNRTIVIRLIPKINKVELEDI